MINCHIIPLSLKKKGGFLFRNGMEEFFLLNGKVDLFFGARDNVTLYQKIFIFRTQQTVKIMQLESARICINRNGKELQKC
jgi:hypothetical protein